MIEDIIVASSFPKRRVNELVFQKPAAGFSRLKEKIRTVLGNDKIKSTLFTVREEPEYRVWIASSANGIEKREFFELEGNGPAEKPVLKDAAGRKF